MQIKQNVRIIQESHHYLGSTKLPTMSMYNLPHQWRIQDFLWGVANLTPDAAKFRNNVYVKMKESGLLKGGCQVHPPLIHHCDMISLVALTCIDTYATHWIFVIDLIDRR